MALAKMISRVITFDGTAQAIATALNLPTNKQRAYRVELQPDTANTHVCYYGGPTTGGGETVATTGIRLEVPESGVPSAPAIWEVYGTGLIDLADFYVLGTNGEKLRIAWLIYV